VEGDVDRADLELQYRGDALDALDHAGRDGREEQRRRSEGVAPARAVGVEGDGGLLGRGHALVCVEPASGDIKRQLVGHCCTSLQVIVGKLARLIVGLGSKSYAAMRRCIADHYCRRGAC
jgi:hypothetical protein